MDNQSRKDYWQEAFAIQGSVTPHVLKSVLIFGLVASVICGATLLAEKYVAENMRLDLLPFEFAGAALGLLLVLRTNAGYERWWEARILWGGIVNQSRNVAISGLAYGPKDARWRSEFVKWAACFSHASRCSLRGEPPSEEIRELLGEEDFSHLEKAGHLPGFVAMKLALLLQQATTQLGMDQFAFMQVDQQRALLIDHVGGCERILKTPLPPVYSIKIRRFITLFLVTLPFALLHRLGGDWLVPLMTMLVAYPLLSLDQIGVELQNPFYKKNLGHLPLTTISNTIGGNLEGYLQDDLPALERGSGD
ncbi:MAG: hypothetical protein JKY95_07735 [Planctomycetaceae bacterium]|nr:hypothetical protein [Planctomycetaceae bacterium]